jgi:Family of unknown function (DUF6527)
VRRSSFRHTFVEFIPDELEDGVIYISITYATVVHACACGCGEEVVTPLTPTDWTLVFDGDSVSLDPSIGNWGFSCRSHYWLRSGHTIWAPQWAQQRVQAARINDRKTRSEFYSVPRPTYAEGLEEAGERTRRSGFWKRLMGRVRR